MVVLLLQLLVSVTALSNAPFLDDWKRIGGHVLTEEAPVDQFQSFIQTLEKWSSEWLVDHQVDLKSVDIPFPYFNFIPNVIGHALPDSGNYVYWETPCYRDNTAIAKTVNDTTFQISVEIKNPKHLSLECEDVYWFGTLESELFTAFRKPGQYLINWTVAENTTSSEMYDIKKQGFRIFKFIGNTTEMMIGVAETAALFECFFTPSVTESCEQRNLYFMQQYANVNMSQRTTNLVELDESYIQSGDFFGVIRLDGVDPMCAWAMGTTTGHTTMALRYPDNSLHVCESTTQDAYWPTNGIQCTPWQQWLDQAMAADHNVIHAPLVEPYRSTFNSTAAYNFFVTQEGFDYGWYNFLFGWIDTIQDNYPCVPPFPSTQCLTWDVIEPLIAIIENLSPEFADKLFLQALNHRLGTQGLDEADLLQEADNQGIPHNQLPIIVEQDGWIYNTTRYGVPTEGQSMICCSFVCEMWKHGGIFDQIDQEINCGEFTDWDDYVLNIFDDTTPLPPQCTAADPTNPLCQIMGKYSLTFDHYDTKDEYPHMAENCPGHAPDYTRPPGC